MSEQVKQLGPRWTKELLLRCSSKELIALVAVYGPLQLAHRMGYKDLIEFIEHVIPSAPKVGV